MNAILSIATNRLIFYLFHPCVVFVVRKSLTSFFCTLLYIPSYHAVMDEFNVSIFIKTVQKQEAEYNEYIKDF